MKICCRCFIEKSDAYFAKDTRYESKLKAACYECVRIAQRLRYKEKKEGIRSKYKQWYKNHKDGVKDRQMKYRYGITLDEYNMMLLKQDSKCRICLKDVKLFNKSFNVDHDHKTGEVRGLLCHNCNVAIGLLNEDIQIFNRIINYLDRS